MSGKAAVVFIMVVAVFLWGGYMVSTAPVGAEIFVRENCNKCHRLRGEGLGTHDLTGIEDRRSRTWMRDQIRNPRLHDPHPGMPSFAHLSSREVEALLDHIRGGPDR